MNEKIEIALNRFVKRQTPESEFAHYQGTWAQLLELIKTHWPGEVVQQDSQGCPRVRLVSLDPQGFFCACKVADEQDTFITKIWQRAPHEHPYLKTMVYGDKVPAQFVKAVLYSHQALAEDHSYTSQADWELISIQATLEENEPMHPLTMARNYLKKPGGTFAHYTLDQVMHAIWYWQDKVSILPKDDQ